MIYMEGFRLPSVDQEERFFSDLRRTCYTNFYPFGLFPGKELERMRFGPVTIFYGSNGSGKTTLLNVIAETIGAQRNAPFSKSSFFGDYVKLCEAKWDGFYHDSTVITSDDVFDYLFNLRALNEGIDVKREDLFREYTDLKYSKFQMRSLADYEQLKKVNSARRNSQSGYVRQNLMQNVRGHSNGESAFMYFTQKIQQNQIYLLDEPENSLSAEYQMELAKFLEDSARFYNCQFIIATHSPFILATREALVYDLDSVPVTTRRWTELGNVRKYYEFFKEHEGEFEY